MRRVELTTKGHEGLSGVMETVCVLTEVVVT